ncbi:hypothetical protein [Streptomyces camponoticapitis]|uniref:hypothetical protein n=1 Tax=Streptomyces camponoticapitis TaxID=1616125 RepID=UPI00166A4FD0|nr:hypothetical protein [Streptomyces camponoticapitis]
MSVGSFLTLWQDPAHASTVDRSSGVELLLAIAEQFAELVLQLVNPGNSHDLARY